MAQFHKSCPETGREAVSKWSDVIKSGKQIASEPRETYLLNTEREDLSKDGLIRRWRFGRKDPKIRNRTIILVGETGTGKSTLINMMLNYMLGVKWKDKIRFEIIQDEGKKPKTQSQTTAITVYDIFGLEDLTVPFSLTVIDTPGYGDTRGPEKDKEISEMLNTLVNSNNGIHQIDAVCLVVKASDNRLTHNQKYIFDTILSLFGKNMKENFLTLITFSNWTTPPVLEAVIESDVPFLKDENNDPVHFLFDNIPLQKPLKNEKAHKTAWKSGMESMENFFKSLDEMETQNLKMTETVLRERQRLEATIASLIRQEGVQDMKRKALEDLQNTLKDHKEDMMKNNNFQYKYQVVIMKLVSIDKYATRCTKCETNCHYPGCWWVSPTKLYQCEVMSAGKCTVCPGKCSYEVHIKDNQIYQPEHEERNGTFEELKNNTDGKMAKEEAVMSQLEQDLKDIEAEKTRLVQQYKQCSGQLKELALKFDSEPVRHNIRRMIEVAKMFKDAEKVEILQKVLKSLWNQEELELVV